ncbi:L-erythro-3-methylmalyl-CoA dehydratase [Hoeflea sp. IMCC20628]|uniref:MaoC family dehydratase n=1 Tax=Hoeflea sp. IMCC20628 TaxID=1620421 RepID=UPI00063AF914|nr:MaoC family dehydratase [Hoeflea sp. IMCC20628]AKH98867.1 L-erythro-3-methylmalyl-CoA dehydratase [Hoeflea sp. IMCC20628]
MTKASEGNFFEDFSPGMSISHAVPRTVTTGDVAMYSALYGMRFAVQSSDAFAQSCGLPRAPLDNLLLFHVIFGKTVPDVSLNAVANLGYAECRFLTPAWPGDSFHARSEVIGVRENSNGSTGIVYVRSTGYNQHGDAVLSFVRWVMVNKRDKTSPAPQTVIPELASHVPAGELAMPEALDFSRYDPVLAGSPYCFDDYEIGEKINHIDGMTIEEAESQIATRLYQNTAKGHFDAVLQRSSRFGRRIVYGGHVMNLARSLSFNGLANGAFVVAINGGRHVNPAAAGDTVYCWSEVLGKQPVAGRTDVGALRVRTVATKDKPCASFPDPATDDSGSVLLDLDYWVLMPRHCGEDRGESQ